MCENLCNAALLAALLSDEYFLRYFWNVHIHVTSLRLGVICFGPRCFDKEYKVQRIQVYLFT